MIATLRLLLPLALPAAAPLPTLAQAVAPTPATSPVASPAPGAGAAGDPAVFLDPFVVFAAPDTGYVASTSLAGSRMGLPIDETPYSISVITSELLDDLGLTDFNSALSLFSGAIPQAESEVANSFNDYNVALRNLGGGGAPPTRNYFPVHFNFDNYNVERIELVRGPNSFLNDNNDFGAVNSSTKQALKRSLTEIRALYSGWGGGRVSLDLNRPLGKKVAARLNLLWEDQDGWRDIERYTKKGLHLALSYQVGPRTLLRTEYEYGLTERYVPYIIGDSFSRWDGVTTASGPLAANPSGLTGLSRLTAAEWVYFPGQPALGIQNFINFPVSNGSQRGLLGADSVNDYHALVEPLPRRFDGSPALAASMRSTSAQSTHPAGNPVNYTATFLTHRFTDHLTLEFASAYLRQQRKARIAGNLWQDVRIDVVRVLPGGQPNPYFGELYTQGRTANAVQENRYYYTRLQLAWNDSLPWLKYRLLAGTNYQNTSFSNDTTVWMVDTGTNVFTSANTDPSIVRPRLYLRDRGQPFTYPSASPGPGLTVRPVHTSIGTPGHNSRYTHQLAFTGSWLKRGLIKTVASLRFDERYNEDVETYAANTRGEFVIPTVIPATRVSDKYATSRNAGVTVGPFKGVNLYASYSQNVPSAPTSVVDINGGVVPEGLRRGYEAGLKGSFLEHRVGFSLNYFINQQANVSTNELSAGADDFDTRIEDIWTRIARPADLPNTFVDTRTFEARGWELETTANLGRSISLRASLTRSTTAVENEFEITRGYLDRNRSAWTTAAASLDAASRQAVLDQIAQLDQRIASRSPGRSLANTYDYTGSLAATYRRLTGVLKGASATLSATLRGTRLVAPYPAGLPLPGGRVATPNDFVTQPGYQIYRLNLGYNTKLRGLQTRFQVNIDNLLGDQELLYSTGNFVRVNATGQQDAAGAFYVANRFSYTSPRRVQLSTTVSF